MKLGWWILKGLVYTCTSSSGLVHILEKIGSPGRCRGGGNLPTDILYVFLLILVEIVRHPWIAGDLDVFLALDAFLYRRILFNDTVSMFDVNWNEK